MTAQRCPEATYTTRRTARAAAWIAAADANRRNPDGPRVKPGDVTACTTHRGYHVLGDVQPTTTKGRVTP